MKKLIFILMVFVLWGCYEDQEIIDQKTTNPIEQTKTYSLSYQNMAAPSGCYYQGGLPSDGEKYAEGETAILKYPDDCITGGTCNAKMICHNSQTGYDSYYKFSFWAKGPYPVYDSIIFGDENIILWAEYEKE
jgi:hypothetical protein